MTFEMRIGDLVWNVFDYLGKRQGLGNQDVGLLESSFLPSCWLSLFCYK